MAVLVDRVRGDLGFSHHHVRRSGPQWIEVPLLSLLLLDETYSGVPLQPVRRRTLENQSKRKNLSAVRQAWINSLSD